MTETKIQHNTDGQMDGWMDGRMDGWMDGQLDGWAATKVWGHLNFSVFLYPFELDNLWRENGGTITISSTTQQENLLYIV